MKSFHIFLSIQHPLSYLPLFFRFISTVFPPNLIFSAKVIQQVVVSQYRTTKWIPAISTRLTFIPDTESNLPIVSSCFYGPRSKSCQYKSILVRLNVMRFPVFKRYRKRYEYMYIKFSKFHWKRIIFNFFSRLFLHF